MFIFDHEQILFTLAFFYTYFVCWYMYKQETRLEKEGGIDT